MKKKTQKIKLVLLVIFLTTFICSTYKMISWYFDNKKTNDLIKELNKNTRKIEKKQENVTDDEEDDSKFLEVDIKSLKTINEETVAWIQVENTNIDYPIVKHKDNKYYLNHSFDKKYNEAGWVFLDHRNNLENLDQNTIIYAHGRVDKTMFGSLKDLLEKDVYEKNQKIEVKLSTEKANYIFEMFSVYHIPTTNDYTNISWNEENYKKFIEKIKKRSSYKIPIELDSNDKIITLSTCYNVEEKVVMHARLKKMQLRKEQ